VAALVVGVIITLGVSCNGFREDEIECEQSVARLEECCPGFRAHDLSCEYIERVDCSDNVTSREFPALSLEDSRCVQKKTCAVLVESGVCTRAQAARRRVVGVTDGGSSRPSPSPTTPPPASTGPICTL
jgi:hypothetical protein